MSSSISMLSGSIVLALIRMSLKFFGRAMATCILSYGRASFWVVSKVLCRSCHCSPLG
jgi:hypothetical protein